MERALMKQFDAVIVGAGPAGMSAAAELGAAGAAVMVVDANAGPGGQLIKQIHKFFGSADVCAGVRGIRLAEKFYQNALGYNCSFLFDANVYAIEAGHTGGYLVYAGNGEKTSVLAARTLILAIGAGEKALAFPGWTLPGVMTAGAAQTLVNLYQVACGKQALILGAGNVGLIVAYQLLQAGIRVEAVIEASAQPGGYQVHADKIRRAGVPILCSHTILEARGKDCVEEALIAGLDDHFNPVPGTERVLKTDAICIAVGLAPLTGLAEIAGCEIISPPGRSDFLVSHDECMRTGKAGIFVAGDAAGVDEASIAIEEGRIAGLYAAVYLGLLSNDEAGQKAGERRRVIQEIRTVGAKRTGAVDYQAYANQVKPKVLIECFQEIPCNPCEKCCPSGAITIGAAISAAPKIALDRCIGCGKCVARCPGQACFMVNPAYSKDESEICLPYEYYPLPKQGSAVQVLDRDGKIICAGRVLKAQSPAEYDKTFVLHILVPRAFAFEGRGIVPPKAEDQ
jgi:thioredoxin reductase/Fe-S-cluster-containing hydrogenase component 2